MENVIQSFSETKKWAKILGIAFIVGFGLNLINLEPISIASGIFTALIPGILLLRYSSTVKAVEESAALPIEELELACEQQASYFKYMGILVIIFLVVVVVAIAAAILVPSLADYIK